MTSLKKSFIHDSNFHIHIRIQRVEIRYFFLASIKYDNFQRGGQNCVGLQYYPHPTSLQMTYPPPPPPNRALLPAT